MPASLPLNARTGSIFVGSVSPPSNPGKRIWIVTLG